MRGHSSGGVQRASGLRAAGSAPWAGAPRDGGLGDGLNDECRALRAPPASPPLRFPYWALPVCLGFSFEGAEMPVACVTDLEAQARELLSKSTWEYIDGGADDGLTRADNVAAFKKSGLPYPFCCWAAVQTAGCLEGRSPGFCPQRPWRIRATVVAFVVVLGLGCFAGEGRTGRITSVPPQSRHKRGTVPRHSSRLAS